jgi:hypothetical protein
MLLIKAVEIMICAQRSTSEHQGLKGDTAISRWIGYSRSWRWTSNIISVSLW